MLALLDFGPDVIELNGGVFDDVAICDVWAGRFAWLVFCFSLSDGSH